MEIVKKSLEHYGVHVKVYLLPRYTVNETRTTTSKLFASDGHGEYPECIVEIREINKQLRKQTKKGTITLHTFSVACPVCDKLMFTIDGMPDSTAVNHFLNRYSLTEHRFVNKNKRSAKFISVAHEGCAEVLALNPLAYLPKLEHEAKTMDYVNFRL